MVLLRNEGIVKAMFGTRDGSFGNDLHYPCEEDESSGRFRISLSALAVFPSCNNRVLGGLGMPVLFMGRFFAAINQSCLHFLVCYRG